MHCKTVHYSPVHNQWSIENSVLSSPVTALAASTEKLRFSAKVNHHFRQYNPVALLTGTVEALEGLAATVTPPESQGDGDTADYCIAVTYTQLTAATALIKKKDYSAAHDLLGLGRWQEQQTDNRLLRRGRKMQMDGRVSFIRSAWLRNSHLLVCIIGYPDLIKIALPGGKRAPQLTTAQNLAVGGESSLEACVREVTEETGIVLQPEQLRLLPRQSPERTGTIFYTASA